jgi:hypothetical protein
MQKWMGKICGAALEIAGGKSLFGKMHENRHSSRQYGWKGRINICHKWLNRL